MKSTMMSDRNFFVASSLSRVVIRSAFAVTMGLMGWAIPSSAQGPVELKEGDHICIIGNTLADRMQHDGWLETLLQARFPEKHLVIRNLGFSGDELNMRLRSMGFGTPDEHLAASKADVIFAFFGYNESFGGREGLDKFKKELTDFIDHTLSQKYNGEASPRLVLFSPIAHEDLKTPNLPNGKANNERIAVYTEAMSQIAKERNVPFVDLYHSTADLYSKAPQPLTINGIHLSEFGNRQLATLIDGTLFGAPGTALGDEGYLEQIRAAVLDKNLHWYNRYRTTDGYSIFGGRADLRFTEGQTNRVVAQRELEILDVMTANRDQNVWAVAERKPFQLDDSNTPAFIPVKTNFPGKGPNGEHIYLGGEEAISKMNLGKGMKVNLVASEEKFPELISPVQMSFDPKGRLWVAVWPSYPHWKPKDQMNDKLLIFEDDDNDGKADRVKTFADRLHNPTGFEFWGGGVIVAMAPDLLFLKDTDGDDKADVRIRIVSGLDTADTHHTSNSFTLDPMGGLYMQEGTFHQTQVETPYGPPQRCSNAGVFRYEPRTQKFEVYVTHPFANPHGHVFDRWGQDFVFDGTGSQPYHGALFSGYLPYPQKHATPPQVYQQRTRPCPGVEILSSRHFPEKNQGNLLVGNVIGFQGILQYKVSDKDSSFTAESIEPIIFSSDPHFRPSDMEMGPDGAIWFTDWQNPIIGHMQHNLRDPSRNKAHGRVYRVTYEGRPLLKPAQVAGAPIPALLDLLKEPEDRVRYRVRIELSGRDTKQVVEALDKWVLTLDRNDPNYEHHLTEALWLRGNHHVVDQTLLERVLASSDFRARAAATKVISVWRDEIPNAVELLKKLAKDEHPRVRLEAVRAASFFNTGDAVEVPLIATSSGSDMYIDYVRGETMKALEPVWRKALREGQEIGGGNEAALRVLLKSVTNEELLRAKRSKVIYHELLERKGIRDEIRQEAIAALAKGEKKPPIEILLRSIKHIDSSEVSRDESVVFDLARLLTALDVASLQSARADLVDLSSSATLPLTRQLAFAAIIAADGNIEEAWKLGLVSPPVLKDLVGSTPFVKDINLRGQLAARIEPLLKGLPEALAANLDKKPRQAMGRFVRVELPGKRTLTLAEVEVISDGKNVARSGKASQKNTASGGDAARGIDGNTSAEWGKGGQTHTEENTDDPWWEVDLGQELPLESIKVHNRGDGELGKRLEGYSIVVLDQSRQVVLRQDKLPAPAPEVTIALEGGDPADQIRRAVMSALVAVPGREAQAFSLLAPYLSEKRDRAAAIHALLAVPAKAWPKDAAPALTKTVLEFVREIPVADRTTPVALDAIQFSEGLAALLPADQAKEIRKELRALGVRIIRVATVPDRMLFDQEILVVEAGKQVEILFENTDIMPHNFVILHPGSLVEVGMASDAMATQPDAVQRNYVPKSDKVLLASKLLQPRDVQKLRLIPPTTPGVYPYVCTYPGHWRRMYGAMFVVKDLEAYLADPSAYLASQSIAPVDEPLKLTRPRQEWKEDDLVPALSDLNKGRSFDSGKQLFTIANCIACHRLNGVGYEVGPDLAKLDPKQTPADILKSVLVPSAKINEKFATQIVELESGAVVTGLVVDETPDLIKVVENPLAKSEPVVIKKSEIENRQASPTSAMPLGMVDRLTREEILDLLAYLVARGNPKHEIFQGEGGHHHSGGH